ncbi:hypothetical protein GF373_12460, partial [bacterium]|nr:hypothetical protein [bacterium]
MASLFIMMNENEIDMIGIRKPRKRLKGMGKTLIAWVLVLFVFLFCGSEAFSAKGSSGGVGDVEKYYKGLQESKKLPLQVFLEVNIFEVILRNEDDIGFIYDILGEVGEFRGTTLAGDPIIESNLGVLGRSARDSLMPAGANIAAAVFEGDSGEIQTVFQALTEDQIVQIHANPIILTVEGYPAQLKSGDEVPFLSRAVLGNTETFV